MVEFLAANWIAILIVVLFVAALVVLAKFGYRKQVDEICFYLVNQAEKEFGGGTGELKYATVVTWLYERLPAIVKFFMSDKTLDDLIEAAVTRMKQYLEENESAKALIVGNPTETPTLPSVEVTTEPEVIATPELTGEPTSDVEPEVIAGTEPETTVESTPVTEPDHDDTAETVTVPEQQPDTDAETTTESEPETKDTVE